MTQEVLFDAITATNATKQEFELNNENFYAYPGIKTSGLGTGDIVTIWEWVNGAWSDSGVTLDIDYKSTTINTVGKYAVTIFMLTAGPASVVVEASGRITV